MSCALKPQLVQAPQDDGEPTVHSPRIYDNRRGVFAVRVLPGEAYVTPRTDEMIVTVLGSCVTACVRDARSGFGGLNHFMLPESDTGEWNGASAAMRYGNYAMEVLINQVLKSGCRRQDLEIKLFGGANLTDGPTLIGSGNVAFVLTYLKEEGLTIASADLGGSYGRRIHYFPSTGVVQRLLIGTAVNRAFADAEHSFKEQLARTPVEGEIDLF